MPCLRTTLLTTDIWQLCLWHFGLLPILDISWWLASDFTLKPFSIYTFWQKMGNTGFYLPFWQISKTGKYSTIQYIRDKYVPRFRLFHILAKNPVLRDVSLFPILVYYFLGNEIHSFSQLYHYPTSFPYRWLTDWLTPYTMPVPGGCPI